MSKESPVVWFVVALLGMLLTGCPGNRPDEASTLPDEDNRAPVIGQGDNRTPTRPSGIDQINPEEIEFGPGLEPRDSALSGTMLDGGAQNVLESIYFGFDEFNIRSSERGKLSDLASEMQQQPGISLIAEGHTSHHGTEEYNLGLGDRRAQAVKTFLVQLGVDPERVSSSSMGELEATSEVGRDDPAAQEDRRVDLILVRQ
ncbi:MAG: OmpA family protein [Opitutales bacterium]